MINLNISSVITVPVEISETACHFHFSQMCKYFKRVARSRGRLKCTHDNIAISRLFDVYSGFSWPDRNGLPTLIRRPISLKPRSTKQCGIIIFPGKPGRVGSSGASPSLRARRTF